jgi:hypothetical protein
MSLDANRPPSGSWLESYEPCCLSFQFGREGTVSTRASIRRRADGAEYRQRCRRWPARAIDSQ